MFDPKLSAGLGLGKRVGSRLRCPAIAAGEWSARRSHARGLAGTAAVSGTSCETVLPARQLLLLHPRHAFATAAAVASSSCESTSVARRRGVEQGRAKGNCGSLATLRTSSKCVSVRADAILSRAASHPPSTHTQQHHRRRRQQEQRRLLSSRDGFGGGQHFPHSDQVPHSRNEYYGSKSVIAQDNHAIQHTSYWIEPSRGVALRCTNVLYSVLRSILQLLMY